MSRITILTVEDEPEVREALRRDLAPFAPAFRLEFAADAAEGREVIAECAADGEPVALVLCDHLLPGVRGTDFLIDLAAEPETAGVRKVLVTGQAGLEDTIRAINQADLDHYVAKPWDPGDLQEVVRAELTEWVLANDDDLLRYVAVLDGRRLLEAAAERGWDR